MESTNHPDLLFVTKHLSMHRDILQKRYLTSKKLQSICEDYRRCHDALAFWMNPDNKNSVKLQAEYSGLLLELEAEIMEILNEKS